MKPPKLRLLLDLVGLTLLGGGLLIFGALALYTIYAFTKPDEALYGAHIPILGFGFLGLGVIGGGALRLIAGIDRRVERLEARASSNGLDG
jgi:hypothetical protein